jgi:hypothetical protein
VSCRFYSFMRYVSAENIIAALRQEGLLKEWEVSDFLEQMCDLDLDIIFQDKDEWEDEDWWE